MVVVDQSIDPLGFNNLLVCFFIFFLFFRLLSTPLLAEVFF